MHADTVHLIQQQEVIMQQRAGTGLVRRAAIVTAAVVGFSTVWSIAGAGDLRAAETAVVAPMQAVSSTMLTDVSAAKRKRRSVRRHRGSSAAGLAFMGAATGLIAGAIADSQRRDYYYGYGPRYGYRGGYYGRPVYGYGGYYARPRYGFGGYYGGPRYYHGY